MKRIYLKSSKFNALYKLFVKIYCDVNIDKWWIKAVYKYWILFYQRKVMDFKAAYIEIYCEMNDVKNMKRLIIWWIYKYWNILLKQLNWLIDWSNGIFYYQRCVNNDFKLIAWFYRFKPIASQLFSAFVHRFKPIASFIAIYFVFQHLKIALNIRIAISFKVCSLKIAILNFTRIIRSFS